MPNLADAFDGFTVIYTSQYLAGNNTLQITRFSARQGVGAKVGPIA
jgi:hypothetical protein